MDNNEEKMIWEYNEKVPAGNYICANCQDQSTIVIVSKDGVKLGTCKLCGSTMWAKF